LEAAVAPTAVYAEYPVSLPRIADTYFDTAIPMTKQMVARHVKVMIFIVRLV
jgi:hypothetical protein